MRRIFTTCAAAALLFFTLAGCHEIRGPLWSQDGKRIVFTTYTNSVTGVLDTSLYVVEADDDNAQPELLAKGAAFPHWKEDGATLVYAGERDQAGFYTKLLSQKAGAAGTAPQALISGLRLVGLQMNADGTLGLMETSSSARMGSPCTVELWTPADNKRTDLKQLGDMYSPALMPNGKYLAYAQKPAAALPLLIVCELETRQPTAVFPTETENEPNATSYVIHAFPDNDRFLFYAPGGTNIWTIRRDGTNIRKYPIPEGLSSPIMVAISEDGTTVSLTLAQAASGKVLYQVYKLDFNAKRFSKMDADSSQLLGGHTLDPRAARRKGPTRYAWLSAAGLSVGEPGRAKFYPLTATQALAASAFHLQQNEPQRASAAASKAHELLPPPEDLGELDRADARAFLAEKKMDHATNAFERGVLLFPVGPDGLKWVFPPASGLPRPTPAELAAALKEMDDLIRALPDNRLVPLLKQALQARSQGNQREALDAYRKAVPLVPDEARVGGIRFLEAMCAYEMGDLMLAGEKWEAAARCTEFPHAPYAAGLAAVAFVVAERAESTAKANAVLGIPVAKNSPLASELNGLPALLRGRTFRERNLSKEAVAPDDSVRTWVEIERYQVPFAYLKPVRVEEQDGKFADRRIGARTVTASAVWLAGMQQPIFRIPRSITVPAISPSNTMLAFSVAGEVFPLPEKYCDVFVIDLRGTLLMGDQRAPYSGQVQSRYIVKNLAWNAASDLSVSGSEIDVFGAELPFAKTLTVPTAAPRQKTAN